MICKGYKPIIITTANKPIGPLKRIYGYHNQFTHKIAHPNPNVRGKLNSENTIARYISRELRSPDTKLIIFPTLASLIEKEFNSVNF